MPCLFCFFCVGVVSLRVFVPVFSEVEQIPYVAAGLLRQDEEQQ